MEIIRSPAAMSVWSDGAAAAGKTIALVPTMGSLHEGHLQLMRMAAREADCVVASLFVNPLQFGPAEDLARYPRDFERDRALLERKGVAVLFAPAAEDMYPQGFQTRVTVGGLTDELCGKGRPDHFEGVTTVVAKLFHLVRPRKAVFGQKDFQQLAVIRRMVRDLNWDIDILGHPIVRENDGLAMSSRNRYLGMEERQAALCLCRAVRHARSRVREGETDAALLRTEIEEMLQSHADVRVEYIEFVDETTLASHETLKPGAVLALAVHVGQTRLIDNGNLFSEV